MEKVLDTRVTTLKAGEVSLEGSILAAIVGLCLRFDVIDDKIALVVMHPSKVIDPW